MNNKQLESWAWVLIYGGLALIALGLFVARASNDLTLGLGLGSIGVLLLVAGIVMVVQRSRRSHQRGQHRHSTHGGSRGSGGAGGRHSRH